MAHVFWQIIVLAVAVTTMGACSSSDDQSPGDAAADSGAVDATADSRAADAPPLSPDCQRLYQCCVGPAAQTAQFCSNLVAGGLCSTWLQSYAMAGIRCN
jgi:hypothetical protein